MCLRQDTRDPQAPSYSVQASELPIAGVRDDVPGAVRAGLGNGPGQRKYGQGGRQQHVQTCSLSRMEKEQAGLIQVTQQTWVSWVDNVTALPEN